MSMGECMRKGLLVKMPPDLQKAHNSLTIAEAKLEIAKKEFNANIFEGAFINAYTTMFHSARALLFKDGIKERSHYCLFLYILEKYRDKIEMKYLNELNSLRMIRHKVMYGDDEEVTIREVEEAEAESAIKIAEGFLSTVRKIITAGCSPIPKA